MKEALKLSRNKVFGMVAIKKIDKYGNTTLLESGGNIVRDWYAWVQKARAYRDVSRKGSLCNIRNYFNSMLSNGAFDNIFLTDVDATPSSSDAGIDYNTFDQANITGHATRQDMTISDDKKGVMVKSKCIETDDSIVMEYQWGTNQAVGTFKSILHAVYGYGYMVRAYLDNPFGYGLPRISMPYKSKQMYDSDGNPFQPTEIKNNSGDTGGVCVFDKDISGSRVKLCLTAKEIVSDNLILTAKPFGAYGTYMPSISVILTIPWQSAYFSGLLPTGYGIISTGQTIVVVISSDIRYDDSLIFKSTDNGLTWGTPVPHTKIKDSVWTDGTYLYGQTWNDSNVYRIPINNITSDYSQYVNCGGRCVYFDGKLRACNNPRPTIDLSSVDWDAHTRDDAVDENICQLGVSYAGAATIAGKAYRYLSVSTDGGDTSYPLFELDLTSQPSWYTSHYKLSTPISKAAEETLVVTYTFTIEEE